MMMMTLIDDDDDDDTVIDDDIADYDDDDVADDDYDYLGDCGDDDNDHHHVSQFRSGAVAKRRDVSFARMDSSLFSFDDGKCLTWSKIGKNTDTIAIQ